MTELLFVRIIAEISNLGFHIVCFLKNRTKMLYVRVKDNLNKEHPGRSQCYYPTSSTQLGWYLQIHFQPFKLCLSLDSFVIHFLSQMKMVVGASNLPPRPQFYILASKWVDHELKWGGWYMFWHKCKLVNCSANGTQGNWLSSSC